MPEKIAAKPKITDDNPFVESFCEMTAKTSEIMGAEQIDLVC